MTIHKKQWQALEPDPRNYIPTDHQFHPDRDVLAGITQPKRTTIVPAGKLPTEPKARKDTPMARGLIDYFPHALAEVADLSRVGNEQHNPGEPMHWAKEKSTDHADCIVRHLVDRGMRDTDGVRHSIKVAWRALAMAEIEILAELGDPEAIRQVKANGGVK